MKKRALLWFTQDLRIQDNSMINWAVTNEYEVMALAFEPAHKSSQQKSLYLMAASEIQESFKTKNISFFILKGKAENEIFNWISLNSIDLVLTQGVYNSRDQKILSKIEEHLKPRQIKKFFNRTLLDSDHLPLDLSNLPLVFTDFRKVVEASNAISKPLQTSIEKLNGFSILIPDNAQFLAATAGEHQKITPFDISATESGSKHASAACCASVDAQM